MRGREHRAFLSSTASRCTFRQWWRSTCGGWVGAWSCSSSPATRPSWIRTSSCGTTW